jgi:hypothetical protein
VTPQEQVDYLKSAIKTFLEEVKNTHGNASLEGIFFAYHNLEQSLNVHDCQDPKVGCSCSGSVRFPN